MYREAAQAPEAVREQLQANAARVARLTERLTGATARRRHLRARQLRSRRHLCRYLIETRLGCSPPRRPHRELRLRRTADLAGAVGAGDLAVGGQPDLLATVSSARAAGAYIVALVNAETSPSRSWLTP